MSKVALTCSLNAREDVETLGGHVHRAVACGGRGTRQREDQGPLLSSAVGRLALACQEKAICSPLASWPPFA